MAPAAATRKPDITGGQMAASAGVNCFFIVNTLVDLSLAHWALKHDQLGFLQQVRHFARATAGAHAAAWCGRALVPADCLACEQVLRWRESEGIIGGIMFVLQTHAASTCLPAVALARPRI